MQKNLQAIYKIIFYSQNHINPKQSYKYVEEKKLPIFFQVIICFFHLFEKLFGRHSLEL